MANLYDRTVLPRMLEAEMGVPELEETREMVAGAARGVVLELGIGPGFNLPHYSGIEMLYALDPLEEFIDMSKKRGETEYPLTFLTAPAEAIPLPDNSIDTVVSTWTLCSVQNPEKVLQEVKRVLKPNGVFLFAEHGGSPDSLVRLYQSAYTACTKYFTGNCHYNRMIDELISDAGFDFIQIEYPPEEGKPLIYNYEGRAVPLNKV